MSKKFTWILPSSFSSRDKKDFDFDLTEYFKTLTENKFWERTIGYNRQIKFEEESFSDIKSIRIKIFPHDEVYFFIVNRHVKLIKSYIRSIDKKHLYIVERGNLRAAKSIAIIEIEYENDTPFQKIRIKKDEFNPERYYDISIEFNQLFLRLTSLANEILSFLLTALNLTFPTINSDIENHRPQSGGLVIMTDLPEYYVRDYHSDILRHPILIEEKGSIELISNLKMIASIWQKDLWPIHRFLKALETDHVQIDNLLDLIFTLESLFPNSTSAETIRNVVVVTISSSLKEAQENDLYLKIAFRIRNEVAHGGKYYRIYDHFIFNQNSYFIFTVFWKVKVIVVSILKYTISNLISGNGSQKSLSINSSHIYTRLYSRFK